MNKSLKIGIIAGLVAGFVSAIYTIFIHIPLVYELGAQHWFLPPPPETPLMKIATNEMINGLLWGAIVGLIYAWVYRVIPGKGVSKGLVYGLFYYLITNVYWVTYFLIYWYPPTMISNLIRLPMWIIFGIVIGTLNEFLRGKYQVKKEPKVVQYSMMGGFQPGVIAGFLSAFSTFFTVLFIELTAIGMIEPVHLMEIEFDLSFILSQLGGQTMWHMIWGIFLALIYPKVYNLVPGKGITKGLVYGLVANYLLNEIRSVTEAIGYGLFGIVVSFLIVGPIYATIYGIVLGYLYKPKK